jgi:hypothetical protein
MKRKVGRGDYLDVREVNQLRTREKYMNMGLTSCTVKMTKASRESTGAGNTSYVRKKINLFAEKHHGNRSL